MAETPTALEVKVAALMPRIKAVARTLAGVGVEQLERSLVTILAPLITAYLLASMLSGLLAQQMVKSTIAARSVAALRNSGSDGLVQDRPIMANVRDLQKSIKDRNIFNSDGKFPEEKLGGEGERALARFDIDSPCVDTTLPIELLGTIFLGDRFKSLATVKDKSYSEADIYRVGDAIYGNEQAVVAAVERQKIIINNNGVKECINLDKGSETSITDGLVMPPSGDFASLPSNGGVGGSEIVLDASYVEGELGPGFGKIVDAARLVPNPTQSGGISGFKIFAIKGGTLFARIGLQNGDVITQVNEVSMKQAEQGFALYQAFQDEKDVRIQLLRGGESPQSITVRIK
jgi:general secretion pathway protein C